MTIATLALLTLTGSLVLLKLGIMALAVVLLMRTLSAGNDVSSLPQVRARPQPTGNSRQEGREAKRGRTL